MTSLDFAPLGDPNPVVPPARFHPPVRRHKFSGTVRLLFQVAGYPALLIVIYQLGSISLNSIVRSGRGEASTLAPDLPILLCVFIAVATIVLIVVQVRSGRRRLLAFPPEVSVAAELPQFALANNLSYTGVTSDPDYPGALFGLPEAVNKVTTDHLQPTSGREFDIGTLEYTINKGKQQRLQAFGYIAVRLDRALPNMVLSSIANRQQGVSELPPIDGSQKLQLEGDFNEYFTLYCPKGYERDALYFFTPDLMELLIDEVGDFDVEVVDDWFFVYSPRPFTSVGVHTWERLFRIVDIVGAKAAEQAEHYSDPNATVAGSVAPAGARLQEHRGLLFTGTLLGICAYIAALWGIWSLLMLVFPAGAPLPD
ncbi:MAG: hypothetical protein JWN80_2619 [Microbacteriaceae bacterium]|nr:hypothetical protein [Microbacteriaceae bacterium]